MVTWTLTCPMHHVQGWTISTHRCCESSCCNLSLKFSSKNIEMNHRYCGRFGLVYHYPDVLTVFCPVQLRVCPLWRSHQIQVHIWSPQHLLRASAKVLGLLRSSSWHPISRRSPVKKHWSSIAWGHWLFRVSVFKQLLKCRSKIFHLFVRALTSLVELSRHH